MKETKSIAAYPTLREAILCQQSCNQTLHLRVSNQSQFGSQTKNVLSKTTARIKKLKIALLEFKISYGFDSNNT